MKKSNSQKHVPVLLDEVLSMVSEISIDSKLMLDGTFGRGGHTKALLNQIPNLKVVAIDRDLQAIKEGELDFNEEVSSGRIEFKHMNFSDIKKLNKSFDIILLDLGVSSPQLDEAHRGFSFYNDGPLDMRMDTSQELSARDIVNTWSPDDLTELFQKYGDLRRPEKIVNAIVESRKETPFSTTLELADFVAKKLGWRKKGHHPATSIFMALRIEVNKELHHLDKTLEDMIDCLTDQGRLLVITFHSTEDRLVKWTFKSLQDKGKIITKKVIQPKYSEKKINPRARSAKLRVFEKGASL